MLLMQSGVEKLGQLRVLFLSNNKVKDWTEIDRLAAAERLEDLLLVGNPLYNDHKDNNTLPEYRVEVGAAEVHGNWVQWHYLCTACGQTRTEQQTAHRVALALPDVCMMSK